MKASKTRLFGGFANSSAKTSLEENSKESTDAPGGQPGHWQLINDSFQPTKGIGPFAIGEIFEKHDFFKFFRKFLR